MTPIKYVGKRSSYTDNLYSRLTFEQGESLMVPDDIAVKMLKHPDQYVSGDSKTARTVDISQPEPVEDTQDLRDTVMQLTSIDALADMALNDYGIKLDKRKSLDNLRTDVVQLIDRYGAVA